MAKNNHNKKAKKVKKLTAAQKEERTKRALRKEELFAARAERWETRKAALTAAGGNPEMAKYSEAEGSEVDSEFEFFEEDSEDEVENHDQMDMSNQTAITPQLAGLGISMGFSKPETSETHGFTQGKEFTFTLEFL